MTFITTLLNLISCGSLQKEKTDKNEADISQMKIDIQLIKENHLFHLERDIAEMKTDIKIILSKIK